MQTVVITGPTSGIGRVTALTLGASGYHVVAAGRSRERIDAVVGEITEAGGSAEPLIMDLSSLNSVSLAAGELEDRAHTIDILINNAGIGMTRGITSDGFEINFGVNHLGPFLFTQLLRRTFRPGTRIVTVSSAMHFRAKKIDFTKLERSSSSFLGLQDYAVSKLANVLFTTELARRQTDWRTYAVHPGFTNTKIIPLWVKPLLRGRLITPEQGAQTTLWCATEETLADESGNYYSLSAPATPSDLASDDDLARDLWARSELWCGVAPLN